MVEDQDDSGKSDDVARKRDAAIKRALSTAHTPTKTIRRNRQTTAKRKSSTRVIIHRGIKIVPVEGKRSPTAKILRDELKRRADRARGKAPRLEMV